MHVLFSPSPDSQVIFNTKPVRLKLVNYNDYIMIASFDSGDGGVINSDKIIPGIIYISIYLSILLTLYLYIYLYIGSILLKVNDTSISSYLSTDTVLEVCIYVSIYTSIILILTSQSIHLHVYASLYLYIYCS
jgi:hypothetical protein